MLWRPASAGQGSADRARPVPNLQPIRSAETTLPTVSWSPSPRLAFDLALPTENAGTTALVAPDREEAWVRRLFEKAILGFARVELEPLGWSVRGSIPLEWQFSSASAGLATILPRMVTDIVLDAPNTDRRLVVDTKFTSVLGNSRFGDASLKSGYLYQMYAYLRSQEGRGLRWDTAAGLFLHPMIGALLHEHVVIQNHSITFATVDLSGWPRPFETSCGASCALIFGLRNDKIRATKFSWSANSGAEKRLVRNNRSDSFTSELARHK